MLPPKGLTHLVWEHLAGFESKELYSFFPQPSKTLQTSSSNSSSSSSSTHLLKHKILPAIAQLTVEAAKQENVSLSSKAPTFEHNKTTYRYINPATTLDQLTTPQLITSENRTSTDGEGTSIRTESTLLQGTNNWQIPESRLFSPAPSDSSDSSSSSSSSSSFKNSESGTKRKGVDDEKEQEEQNEPKRSRVKS